MSVSTAKFAYVDCFDLMDQALDDPVGVRKRFDDYGTAKHFVMRMHYARKLDRQANMVAFAEDHPMYGQSNYDHLIARDPREDREGKWWIYVERRVMGGVVETLSEEESDEAEAHE
jgi:hypothetical protein